MANTLQMLFNIDVAMSNGWNVKFSGLEAGFERLRKASSDLQAQSGKIGEYQKMQGALSSSQKSLETLRAQMSRNAVNLHESREKTARLSSEYDKAKAKLAALSQQYKPHSILVQTAKMRVKELEQQYKSSSQETQRLEQTQAKLSQSIAQADTKVNEQTKGLEAMKKSLSDAGIKTGDLAAQQDRLTQAQNKLNRARENLSSIKEQLNWGNIKGDILTSAGLLMAFKQPINIDMEFEQSMANVKAVMNPLQEEFDALRNQALELGRTTQFSASQAAASQENLARAGFSTKQILDTMPGLLSMAAAEGMDLAQAATILAGGLRGMNLDMSQTMRLADAFAYTSAHSATNIANLGEAFKAVAATASMQGASPEQLLSYLGVLANLQVEAGEAGNAIKSAFMRLSNPAKEAQKVFAKFGIQVVKNGRMRELGNLLEELYKKTEKLGSAEQLKAFSIVFGKNYGDSLIKLAKGVMSGDQQELLRGLKFDKAGASNLMAGMRNDTLKGDLTALSSAWEGLNIAIGNALEPINRFFTQELTKWISKLTEFINQNKELCNWAIQIGYAYAGWKILNTVFKYGKLLVSLPFAKLNVLLAEQAAKSALAGHSFSLIGSLMNTLLHPLSALKDAFMLLWGVVAAHPFLALIAVASALYIYWDDIVKLWHEGLDWFSAKWEWLKEFWANLSLSELFKEMFSWLELPDLDFTGWIEPVLNFANYCEELSNKFFALFTDFEMPDIFAPLRQFFDDAVNYVKEKWQSVVDWFKSLNPFSSWSAPAAPSVKIGGVNHDTGGSKQVENALRAINGMATGGIVKEHSIIQVAERGPEAIIPLNDKSRGLTLLNVAANKLGVAISGVGALSSSNINNQRNLSSHAQGEDYQRGLFTMTRGEGLSSLFQGEDYQSGLLSMTRGGGLSSLFQGDDYQRGGFLRENLTAELSPDIINQSNQLQEVNSDYGRTINSRSIANLDGNNINSRDMVQRPPLTFNIQVSSEGEGLAERIAAAVRIVIDNLSEYEERVAYA